MAQHPLEGVDLRRAGEEYAEALEKLGFEPEIVCWAVKPSDEWTLVLVTDWADRFGPKALYDLLFEAYDAAATPRTINPFYVTVLSPTSYGGAELVRMIAGVNADIARGKLDKHGALMVIGMMELGVAAQLVIRAKQPSGPSSRELRRFERFRRNVAALAA